MPHKLDCFYTRFWRRKRVLSTQMTFFFFVCPTLVHVFWCFGTCGRNEEFLPLCPAEYMLLHATCIPPRFFYWGLVSPQLLVGFSWNFLKDALLDPGNKIHKKNFLNFFFEKYFFQLFSEQILSWTTSWNCICLNLEAGIYRPEPLVYNRHYNKTK